MSTDGYEDTVTISSLDTLDIDTMTMANSVVSSTYPAVSYPSTSSILGGAQGANYTFTTNGTGYTQPWVTVGTAAPNTLDVKGDANFEGDITFKGRSLQELFAKIEDRLSILQPDPKKLEKYEALRKAYEHYKLMEKLVQED